VNPAPILQVITAREAVAGLAADQLREQIDALSQQLSVLETELADLAITRTTLLRLTGHPDDGHPDDDGQSADSRPPNPAYQQILAVLGTAEYPLRAKDICLALGTGTTANHTESLRAKLKRLVTRGVLTEDQPGLFALAPSPAGPADATVA
jgi:polyhydroxyalkanoate synthesis regulator phasin